MKHYLREGFDDIGTDLTGSAQTPSEVERLRAEIERMRERVTPTHKSLIGKHAEIIKERDTLRAQLADISKLPRVDIACGDGGIYADEEPEGEWVRWSALNDVLSASAEPIAPKCETCNGTGMVDDGEITCSEGGIPYENGPVKCMKYCPACKPTAPVECGERAEFEAECSKRGYVTDRHLMSDSYKDPTLQRMWEMWQARAALERKPGADLPPVKGDLLPPIGSKVLIHLAREDKWVEHTVVGYYAWENLRSDPGVYRVSVRVRDADGYLNARSLGDIRYMP